MQGEAKVWALVDEAIDALPEDVPDALEGPLGLVESIRAVVQQRNAARAELEAARAVVERTRMAATASGADLAAIGALCNIADDEYPLRAVERVVRERDATRAAVERWAAAHTAYVGGGSAEGATRKEYVEAKRALLALNDDAAKAGKAVE